MHSDKDRIENGADGAMDPEDESREKSLKWLLDMDMSEPEETLFQVADDQAVQGLSAYEAEVAARPLVRGNASSDSLDSFVAEEIVISSDPTQNDIYADSGAAGVEGADSETAHMAIDYTRDRVRGDQVSADVEDGTDILGLASDDDMGETHLTIKRVKVPAQAASTESPEATSEENPVPGADGERYLNGELINPETADTADTIAVQDAAPEDEIVEADDGLSLEFDSGDLTLGDIAPDEVALDETEQPRDEDSAAITLSGAPVPTQVVEPLGEFGANEISLSEETGSLQDFLEGDEFLSGEVELEIEPSDDMSFAEVGENAVEAESIEAAVPDFDDFEELAEVAEAAAPDLADGFGGDTFELVDGPDSSDELVVFAATDESSGVDDFLGSSDEEDEAFEQLLAQSADSITTDADLDSLDTISLEDDEPVAPAGIDYPEDFHALAEAVAVLAPLNDELSRLATERVKSLDMAADAVTVDVILGTDETAIKHCYAEGYEPVMAVCELLPEAMAGLEQAQRDLLYVRMSDTVAGGNWNHLFTEEFAREHQGEAVDAIAESTAGDVLDDFLGDDLDDEFDEVFAGAEDADIDAVFADMEDGAAFVDSGVHEDEDFEQLAAGLAQEEEVASLAVAEDAVEESAIEEAAVVESEPAVDAETQVQAPVADPDTDSMAWCIPAEIAFDYTSASSSEIFTDFLDSFIEESGEEVEKMENIIGAWEKAIDDESAFAAVNRTLHTIKGIAKGVGLHRLGTLVHNFETLLDKMARPAAGEQLEYFRIVNAWLDAVVRGVEFVGEHRADIASELPASRLAAPPQAPAAPADEAPVEPVSEEYRDSVPAALEEKRDKQLADEGAKAAAQQQSVRLTSEKMDHLLNLASQAQQFGVRASQSISRNKRSTSELQGRLTSVRTHIRKIADRALFNVSARGNKSAPDLDALEMDQYTELQEAASILREGIEDLTELVDLVSRQNSQVEGLLKQQSTVISSISSSIQGARVVPVSRLMPGLRRIVRTVSTDLGKVVSFKVLNETGALDRDRYARLQVILEHMVRNALDHGIESPDERVAVGKPTGGRITIEISKSGGDYVIKLSDDGRGMDPDALRESAYEKGLDVDVDALSDEEALRLIFHKGFSTASQVSEISGRGVGMDIVLTELQQIGGDIQISSALGLGTSFEVRIPSNVTVNGALLVTAADDSYAIPLNGLVAVEQVPVEEFFNAVQDGRRLHLADFDCEPAYLGTLCQGVGLPDRTVWDAFVPVIIAGSEERYMAIAIDSLEEALELVVRSIGAQFSTVPGVAGAATTAEGEAVVALDLNLLVASAGADGIATVAFSKPENNRLLALVVDDSRTQRMVATSQLDTVGVETVTAENGLVAIDLLNAAHRLPDVVLLDVEMPVKDGIETLREIRKSRRYGDLPVIMVTSRTGAKHRAMAKDAGCNAYMGKPFNFPALIEQINDLTGRELQLS